MLSEDTSTLLKVRGSDAMKMLMNIHIALIAPSLISDVPFSSSSTVTYFIPDRNFAHSVNDKPKVALVRINASIMYNVQ